MAKIKISIPADAPQVSVEVDTDTLAKVLKEALEKLPFKVEWKEKREGGEH
ncbi:MAG: hypothetical protein JRE40_02040 [Deltaproteobacteria bacterium]|nr:hypothetical protein [Deltaproteobacteria bacterium]MBW2672532.1 hypothetical protein [Deltaproteobacteria bacterium]